MKYYFKIQISCIRRIIIDSGFPLFVAIPFILLLFAIPFGLLQQYPSWAEYLIGLTAIQLLTYLSDQKRNDFLRTVYSAKHYYSIRVVENSAVGLPLFLSLLLFEKWIVASCIITGIFLFPYVRANLFIRRSIPTPFKRHPFEFIYGYRKNIFILLLIHLLGVISLYVGNLNLGLFSMATVVVTSSTFYHFVEPELFVWNDNRRAAAFLWAKIFRGILHCSILLLPLGTAMLLTYGGEAWYIVLVWIFAMFIISFIICMKYNAYPRQIGPPEISILSLSYLFYPLLLAAIPYYYFKAIRKLEKIL